MNDPASKFVICRCQYCDKGIEFDAIHTGETIVCPHCNLETVLFIPQSKQRLPEKTVVPKPSLLNCSNLTIGDISITKDKVITPNGIGNLADSQWIFSDMSRIEKRIPAVAIILAIVFALLCLIGLLFLLMKEETITGYAEVSVHSGNLFHKTQIPIKIKSDVDRIRELVNKAQSLAACARNK